MPKLITRASFLRRSIAAVAGLFVLPKMAGAGERVDVGCPSPIPSPARHKVKPIETLMHIVQPIEPSSIHHFAHNISFEVEPGRPITLALNPGDNFARVYKITNGDTVSYRAESAARWEGPWVELKKH